MNAATAQRRTAPKRARDLVQELIAVVREERTTPPDGDPADLTLQLELLVDLLERGIEYERERAPQPVTRFDLDSGRHVEVAPAQRVRLRDNPVLRGLALWAGYLEDRLGAK